ncbi:hypothetical protein OG394_29465 [Kribbella sp. NBC_01245]|uniref:restriction endonuclease fold toxin-2 domain-containing protein n=1 Tax=Kribbella sp. NBC_01245 TaxID=2903578 RepID=UPI002E2C90D3|nr:restriction endonuclease fold toxin-2 domain-containing protein [Kribbella sp. NBC_01245]
MQQGAADSAERTVEGRPAASTGPDKNSPDSRLDEVQKDRPDRPSNRPAGDAADVVDQRNRRDAATTENPQTSCEATSAAHDASDRLPAKMHEKMLQSPVFTRLGWGSGGDAHSRKEGDVRARDPREQAVGPEGRQDGGEPEIADVPEPATRNGEPAGLDSDSLDGPPSPEKQAEGDSASSSEETAGAGPETPVVADAPNQADEIAATPEDRTLDSEARDDPKSTEPRSDSELADQRSVDEVDAVATVGADEEQRHRLDAAVDTQSTVQDAAMPEGESLTTLPDGKTVAEGRKESETSLLASNADASGSVQTGLEERQWTDPEKRRSWVEERLADPEHTKPVTSDKPWAQYQRARVGDVEVELQTAEPGSTIWADGLEIDPDTVVVVEVKYVTRPDRSLYEGTVPPRMLEVMLRPFDREMYRYASVVQHNANPVERIRLVTSTDAAARFLGERARRILGEDIDLDIQVWSEEEH